MRKILKSFFYIFFCLCSVFFVVNERALAATGDVKGIIDLFTNPDRATDPYAIFDLFTNVFNRINALGLIPFIALLTIMYAGIKYMFAAGDVKKTGDAVKLLNTAVIGFALSLMLLALWEFIKNFIGV